MEQRMQHFIFSLVLGILFPGLLFGLIRGRTEMPLSSENEITTSATPIATQPKLTVDSTRIPVLWEGGIVEQMVLEDYLTGVLIGEMPVTFHPEAKKAQAVAARTVTLRLMTRGSKHEQAVVCSDPTCCQAFVTEQDYLNSGGTKENYALARKAVQETAGEVVYYGDELIDATYFSCSGGRTEDAVAVWGNEVAYLQAVDSPGEEGAAHFEDTLTMTPAELEKKLGVDLSGPPSGWFTGTVYTDGDGVASVRIGGKLFTGRQLRTLLGLRSTSFSVNASLSQIVFSTRGFGHRVGMSQYGADAMAHSGSDYRDILSHYYTGTDVRDYEM